MLNSFLTSYIDSFKAIFINDNKDLLLLLLVCSGLIMFFNFIFRERKRVR